MPRSRYVKQKSVKSFPDRFLFIHLLYLNSKDSPFNLILQNYTIPRTR